MGRRKNKVEGEVTDSLLKFREKRKWQIALRRYVLEMNKCPFYAPYFGLDIVNFRKWIEIQFDDEISWENFSKAWQFDHIVPVNYFDFRVESDLRLCWNFVNIRVEKSVLKENRGNRIDVLAAKSYFEALYDRTKYDVCREMVNKITRIEVSEIAAHENLQLFLLDNKEHLSHLSGFSNYEFERLNSGTPLKTVLWEREFLKKFE